MAYRKISVNGTTYEYMVGKRFLKIKGVGVFDKFVHGDSYFDEYWGEQKSGIITPSLVRHLILNNAIKT